MLNIVNISAITDIKLNPHQMTRDLGSTVLNAIKQNIEGTNNADGYVSKINKILYIGAGRIITDSEKCPIIVPVGYSASIIKIKSGDIIYGLKVKVVEEFGIIATKDNIVDVIIKSSDLTASVNYKENDIIPAIRAITDGNFTVTDNRIYCIGKLHYYSTDSILDNESKKMEFTPNIEIQQPLERINIKTTNTPCELLDELGYDISLDKMREQLSEPTDSSYQLIRSKINAYELLCPNKRYSTEIAKRPVIIKKNIINRAYFKMWEILKVFPDLLSETEEIVSANLAEGPGGFMQAIRDYNPKSKLYGITLMPPSGSKLIPKFNKDFAESKGVSVSYGNINNEKDTSKFIKLVGKADIVTGDAGFQFDIAGEHIQETLIQQLLFNQLLTAIQIQKKGGSLVCKMFSSYSKVTAWILHNIVMRYYDKVALYKPETSRHANYEKYIIARGFCGEVPAGDLKILKQLAADWAKIDASGGVNPEKYITDIINYTIPEQLKEQLYLYNTQLGEFQKEKLRDTIELPKIVKNWEPWYAEQERIARDFIERYKVK